MILYKKDDFITYDDGTNTFSDNNLQIALDDVGDNVVLINIHRNKGYDYKVILTRRFPAIEITDIEGFPYGETAKDVIFGFNVGKDVNLQDQTTPPIEHYLYQELNDVVITGTPVKGTNILTLQAGHNFVAPVGFIREHLNIHYLDMTLPQALGMRFNQFTVIAVDGNNISITPPLPYDFILSNVETTKRVNTNMNILGTFANPVKFETRPPNGQQWDLTRLMPDMILGTGGDDGKFGNIAGGIDNGEYFGFEGDLFTEYQVSIFDNGDLRSTAFDLTYPSRSGGSGDFGMGTRKTLAGQPKSGVAVRLDGANNDKFVKYTQDDLTSIVRYRIKIMGHVVNP